METGQPGLHEPEATIWARTSEGSTVADPWKRDRGAWEGLDDAMELDEGDVTGLGAGNAAGEASRTPGRATPHAAGSIVATSTTTTVRLIAATPLDASTFPMIEEEGNRSMAWW